MKRRFIILTLATQLVAIPAFAQATTGTTETGSTSGGFGSDWLQTLRPVQFSKDGIKLRDTAKIASQWPTLSDENKDTIGRNCALHDNESDSDSGITSTDTSTDTNIGSSDTSANPTGTATDSTTTGMITDDDAPALDMTEEQIDDICETTDDL